MKLLDKIMYGLGYVNIKTAENETRLVRMNKDRQIANLRNDYEREIKDIVETSHLYLGFRGRMTETPDDCRRALVFHAVIDPFLIMSMRPGDEEQTRTVIRILSERILNEYIRGGFVARQGRDERCF